MRVQRRAQRVQRIGPSRDLFSVAVTIAIGIRFQRISVVYEYFVTVGKAVAVSVRIERISA